ncbi:ankyrin repeat-containing domain protein [Melanogaster broomeanus]|nr:ankyrin repeat-containing domain protein [Melanogaster broomeanus]
MAAIGTNLETTQFLVVQGCDINAEDFDGRTPLHYAARHGDLSVIHFLIHSGAQPPKDILHDALVTANRNLQNLHTILRLLLEHGASITSRMKDGNRLSVTRLLIDKGCEVNALDSFGETPLHLAAQLGHIRIIHLLLDRGAKLYGGTIHSAVKTTPSTAFNPILKILTRKGLDDQALFLEIESHGLLHILCRQQFPEAECIHRAQALRQSGFRLENYVNTEDDRGFTPLSIVLNKKEPSPSLVTYLIDIGAKFSNVNYLHLNNLHWAHELSWYLDAIKAY